MPRKKGTPKTGGRQKGTPNRSTAVIKDAISNAIAGYMTTGKRGVTTFEKDLRDLTPVQRVTAVGILAGYVIPRQQSLSIEEQARIEEEALTAWIETAPDEAIQAI